MMFSSFNGKRNLGFLCIIFILFFLIIRMIIYSEWNAKNLLQITSNSKISLIPKIVHQTWKQDIHHLPSDIDRWRKKCMILNQDYDFLMHTDESIHEFVELNYPQYLQLFHSLSGVFMSDMARVLLVYHYGGIYMDTDFYCHRPLHCLEEYIQYQIYKHLSREFTSSQHPKHFKHLTEYSDLLVLSREPHLHSHLLYHDQRTVIQDFFFATPNHPFLLWLLNYVNLQYLTNPTQANPQPFSYFLDHYLDKYYNNYNFTLFSQSLSSIAYRNDSLSSYNNNMKNNKSEIIMEMESRIIHPWIDQSNLRLLESCLNYPQQSMECHDINHGKYLFTTSETMLVHMWTHVYLSNSNLRLIHNHKTYRNIEKSLRPNSICPSYSTYH